MTPREELAALLAANDILLDRLVVSRAELASARAYLDRPGCNTRYGAACLEHCRARHSGILARLRANRIESLKVLGDTDAVA